MVTHDQEEALVDGRPHRRHEPRRDRAGRHADGDLPRARRRPSSPISSARSTSSRGDCIRARDLRIGDEPLRPASSDTDAERDGQGLPAAGGRAARGRSPTATPNVFDARDRQDRVPRLVLPACGSRPRRMGSEPITVYLSLNYLAEQGLEVGSRLPLKRAAASGMRVFWRRRRATVSAVLAAAPPSRRPAPARRTGPTAIAHARAAAAGRWRCVAFLALPLAAHPRQVAAERRRRLRRPRQLRRLRRDAGAAAVALEQRLGLGAGHA